MPKLVSKRHLRRKIANSCQKSINKIIIETSSETNAERCGSASSKTFAKPTIAEISQESDSSSLFLNIVPQASGCTNIVSQKETVPTDTYADILLNYDNSDSNNIYDNDFQSNCRELNYQNEFKQKLRLWALKNEVTHRCINDIITLIKSKYPFLKDDARTLLQTPRHISNVGKLFNGEIVYFGIKSNLIAKLKNQNNIHLVDKQLRLHVNIDGIPIYNSSAIEFWPILVHCKNFNNNTEKPFVVAIFCGVGKPTPLADYLKAFLDECETLITEGFVFKGKCFKIKLEAFCCDAPARAYLKQVTGHSGKYACERCDIASVYCAEQKRRFYPVNLNTLNFRSDADFRHNILDQHIKGISPLLSLDIGLVSNFVLDPMHLIYLGVMKRLITFWLEGKRRQFRLSKVAVLEINNRLISIKKHIPSEFSRKIRTFKDFKRWKAVEFRFFLLYCGIFVLQDNFNYVTYKHFLLLHVAVYILSSKVLIAKYFNDAKKCLQKFVTKCPDVYDKFFVVYNVHSLLHICDDVLLYGPLEEFSCFQYENHLGKMKRYVRGKSLPLAQIHNRIVELSKGINESKGFICETSIIPCGVTNKSSEVFFFCKKVIIALKFTISIYRPDNIVQVGNKIFYIKRIYNDNGTYKCTGQYFKYKDDFYTYPVLSSALGIYYVSGIGVHDIILVSDIVQKYAAFPHKQGFLVVPVIHQINMK